TPQLLVWMGEGCPPDFHAAAVTPLTYLVLLLTFGLAASQRGSVRDLLVIAGALHSALHSSPDTPVFAITCAPIAAGHLARRAEGFPYWTRLHGPSLASWNPIAAVALGILFSVRLAVHAQALRPSAAAHALRFEQSVAAQPFPDRACAFLLTQGWAGRLFN